MGKRRKIHYNSQVAGYMDTLLESQCWAWRKVPPLLVGGEGPTYASDLCVWRRMV